MLVNFFFKGKTFYTLVTYCSCLLALLNYIIYYIIIILLCHKIMLIKFLEEVLKLADEAELS